MTLAPHAPGPIDRTTDHARLDSLLIDLHRALVRRDAEAARVFFAADATALTSHLGAHRGAEEIAAALVGGVPAGEHVRLRISNAHTAFDGEHAVQSSYVLLISADETPTERLDGFLAGAHQTLRWAFDGEEWRITELRVQLDWHHGSRSWASGWTLPDGVPGWHRGWVRPAVSAWADSPWRAIPSPDGVGSEEDRIRATYIRYAWGIDQQDIALMASAFTEDVEADMSPFGSMSGRAEVVDSLGALRNGQPYLQHAAPVLDVELDPGDPEQASMTIYRTVPHEVTLETLDAPVYGAHYTSRLRREDGLWRFSRLRYVPGWIQGPRAWPEGE